jgi:Ca2+-binding RTX toxin-like protein
VISLGDGDDTYDGSTGRISQPSSFGSVTVGKVDGGAGSDMMIGGAGAEAFFGGTGTDTMEGRGGNDFYVIDNPGDVVVEAANGGFDAIESSITITIGANIERVDLSVDTAVNATGNALNNIVQGRLGANILSGLAGNDQIFAFNGNDRLIGGLGADRLSGMLDADRFVFNSVAESRAAGGIDRIMDFSRAQLDKIQLNTIDADTAKAGNQAFKFIATAAFSGAAGELRFQKIGNDTHIQADVNGDGKIDMTIISDVVVNFAKGDFIL